MLSGVTLRQSHGRTNSLFSFFLLLFVVAEREKISFLGLHLVYAKIGFFSFVFNSIGGSGANVGSLIDDDHARDPLSNHFLLSFQRRSATRKSTYLLALQLRLSLSCSDRNSIERAKKLVC